MLIAFIVCMYSKVRTCLQPRAWPREKSRASAFHVKKKCEDLMLAMNQKFLKVSSPLSHAFVVELERQRKNGDFTLQAS